MLLLCGQTAAVRLRDAQVYGSLRIQLEIRLAYRGAQHRLVALGQESVSVAAGRQRPCWLGGHYKGQPYHQLQAKLSVEPPSSNVGKREGRGGEKLVSEWRLRYSSMAPEPALQSFRRREESRAVHW